MALSLNHNRPTPSSTVTSPTTDDPHGSSELSQLRRHALPIHAQIERRERNYEVERRITMTTGPGWLPTTVYDIAAIL